jgi:hypothetical protein
VVANLFLEDCPNTVVDISALSYGATRTAPESGTNIVLGGRGKVRFIQSDSSDNRQGYIPRSKNTCSKSVTWLMAPGQTNALQVSYGGVHGDCTTNNFTDLFVVTNNPTPGSVTNYLDIGAGTNFPSRYYRARLAP